MHLNCFYWSYHLVNLCFYLFTPIKRVFCSKSTAEFEVVVSVTIWVVYDCFQTVIITKIFLRRYLLVLLWFNWVKSLRESVNTTFLFKHLTKAQTLELTVINEVFSFSKFNRMKLSILLLSGIILELSFVSKSS